MAPLISIKASDDKLEIVNQLLLPHTTQFIQINTIEEAHDAIKTMKVGCRPNLTRFWLINKSKIRGAPAIASLAALSVAQYLTRALRESSSPDYLLSLDSLKSHIDGILSFLYTSRPTAVNLGVATRRLTKTLNDGIAALKNPRAVAQDLVEEAKAVADEDVGRNKQMSKWAGDWLLERVHKQGLDASRGLNVLTVCNTGSLATSVCLSISFLPLTGNLIAW